MQPAAEGDASFQLLQARHAVSGSRDHQQQARGSESVLRAQKVNKKVDTRRKRASNAQQAAGQNAGAVHAQQHRRGRAANQCTD